MPFPSWRPASRFEPSSALVLIIIGLAGFLVDLLLKPISDAGLALLLLAATPSLVALFKRAPLEAVKATAASALAAPAPQRGALPRATAPDGPGAAPKVSPQREGARDEPETRGARGSSERPSPEPVRQPAVKASPPLPPRPDQARVAAPGRAQRQPEAEPARPRVEAPIGGARRPAEPARIPPNAL